MKRIFSGLTIAALSLCVSVAGPAARAETLADALASAYNTSGLLEQNRALLRAADEGVAQAVAALRPVINWSAKYQKQFSKGANASTGFASTNSDSATLTLGLTAQLVLYDFGAGKLGVEVAKESVLGARYSLIAVEQQILFRAVTAFFEVRRASEFLALRQSNVRLITQELRAARDRFEVGEVTRTDVSLAEARLAAAKSGLAAAQGALNRAKLEYGAAVGRDPGRLSAPRGLPRAPKSVEMAMATAVRNHPEFLAAQKDVTVAELNVTVADLAIKPTIKGTAGLGLTENFHNDGFGRSVTFGLEASGPIYAGGRLSSLQRQAMARRDASRSNLHVAAQSVRQSAGNAFSDVLVSRASRQAIEQQVRAAQVAFRGVREETTLGARTTLDVLNAEQELLEARANLISAQIDEYLGAYRLLASMGQLTASYLRLNVQIFDPAAYYNMVEKAPAYHSQQGKKLDKVLRRIGKE